MPFMSSAVRSSSSVVVPKQFGEGQKELINTLVSGSGREKLEQVFQELVAGTRAVFRVIGPLTLGTLGYIM
jgi:hypothetical protein